MVGGGQQPTHAGWERWHATYLVLRDSLVVRDSRCLFCRNRPSKKIDFLGQTRPHECDNSPVGKKFADLFGRIVLAVERPIHHLISNALTPMLLKSVPLALSRVFRRRNGEVREVARLARRERSAIALHARMVRLRPRALGVGICHPTTVSQHFLAEQCDWPFQILVGRCDPRIPSRIAARRGRPVAGGDP